MRASLRSFINQTRQSIARKPSQAAESAFREEFLRFEKLFSAASPKRFELRWEDRYPCLEDKTSTTDFDRHYVYHTGWAARVLARTRPQVHVDISSYLYFSTIVSAFIPVRFYDYRPAQVQLSDLTTEPVDLMALPFDDGSVHSLSCMHVVEHIGLGRYGDPLDPEGDLKAMAELKRVLAIDGMLLFVVPIGKPVIMFNAHRIYSYDQIITGFKDLELKEFALIPDDSQRGGLMYGATREMADEQNYGCGCFLFTRKES
jgi:hypothetical protein